VAHHAVGDGLKDRFGRGALNPRGTQGRGVTVSFRGAAVRSRMQVLTIGLRPLPDGRSSVVGDGGW